MPEETMRDAVVIEFAPEAKAEAVRQKSIDMRQGYPIELGDAVVAVKQPNGRVKLNQLLQPTAFGAASSTLWVTLLIRSMMTDKVAETLNGVGGKLLHTSFDRTKEVVLPGALAAAAAKPSAISSAA